MTYLMHNWVLYWLFTMVYACVPHFNQWSQTPVLVSVTYSSKSEINKTLHGDWPGPFPASREMLDRRWANVVTYVGATSANDVGPMWICPSVQHWHDVVTPPTMTLCQRFANVITYCILLYLMVGTTFAHCLYEWLAKHWHNFIIAHCLSTVTIKITSFIWKAVA